MSYWSKRQETYLSQLNQKDRSLEKKLEKIYAKELSRIEKEIGGYYASYGKDNILQYKDLLKQLTPSEVTNLYENTEQFFLQNPNIAHLEPVRNSFYKLTRLEGLEQSIKLEQYKMAKSEIDMVKEHLEDAYKKGMRVMQDSSFNFIDKDAMEVTLNESWCEGKNFSKRIWDNRTRLAKYLHKEFVNHTIRGDSYQKSIKDLRLKFPKVEKSSIKRLIRTEGTYIGNEALGHGAGMTDEDMYYFSATMDRKTSSICKGLDGTGPYKWKDRVPGLNFPPMHPNCRSSFDFFIDGVDKAKKVSDNGVIETGAKKFSLGKDYDIINDKEYKRQQEHAIKYYNSLVDRHRDNMINKIHKHADDKSISKKDVARMLEHILDNEYDLIDGRRHFTPDYDMSQSLQRLIDGRNVKPHDITLIKHESLEYKLMNIKGFDSIKAHDIANTIFNYIGELEKYKEGKE